MTVCIGAVCESGRSAVVAADRMFTYGPPMSLQIEPPVKKIRILSDKAVLLFSGGVPDGEEVATRTIQAVKATNRPPVAVIAEFTRQAYEDTKRKRVEDGILKPFLGINYAQWQQLITQAAASQVIAQMLGLIMQNNMNLDILVAGIDDSGAHLFVVTHPGILLQMQTTGFATIGSGGTHAGVRISLGCQTPDVSLDETIFNVYEAKLSSEVAPGVGKSTDMAVLNSKGVTFVSDLTLTTLNAIRKEPPKLADSELAKLRAACKEYADESQPHPG
jgi:20S proteasome alpha/beta subunit